MKPDPLKELLTGLAPRAAQLDRDALLFEAGRQSIRPSRLWPTLCGGLAVSQGILLTMWLMPQPIAPAVDSLARIRLVEPQARSTESPEAWSLGRRGDLPVDSRLAGNWSAPQPCTAAGIELGLRGSPPRSSGLLD